MRPKLLLLDEPCKQAREIMESVCDIDTSYCGCNDCCQYDMVYTQLNPIKIDVPVFCPCTGVDHIQAPNIIHLDDEWKRTEGREVTSTAEHTWSLILQLAKLNKMQLSGRTIGIIGCGRIGQKVAEYAHSFEIDVKIVDSKANTPFCKHFFDMEYEEYFNSILRSSDIITLHVPLNEETRGMIGKEQFDMMKPGVLLINTSRAEIVNEDALIEAISKRKIGGYADDFEYSHNKDFMAYVNADKFITTPHIGGDTIEAREATDMYIANKITEYVRRSENICSI